MQFRRGKRESPDPLAVGLPGRIALGCVGGVGEIANITMLDGNGEDFAVRFKDGAGAGRRDVGVLDFLAAPSAIAKDVVRVQFT